jgi:hypothetical protein
MAAQFRSQGNPFATDPDRGWEKHISAARIFLAELGIHPPQPQQQITGKRLIQLNLDGLDEAPPNVEKPEE